MNIKETDDFKNWMRNLKDHMARAIINARIRRLSLGNKGDAKYLSDGVSELRVDYGPGYRVYFFEANREIIILLCGGDKSSQRKDIEKAKKIIINLEVTE
ncbi:MAG: type II toxin-antitoxin system RelE/ParE family toxin [Lachnospiraceae bacterium]|nr:type II toxin-antitoxin system RelE/ParE family toxin [Lachnospiraceae bacterium]